MIDNSITVYCQHGDETFGALAAMYLDKLDKHSLLGNPRAFVKGVRYIDADLNRSYSRSDRQKGYEDHRAADILNQVSSFDLVIDIHTSRANVGKIAILPSPDIVLFKIAHALGFDMVAVMPPNIANVSLVGNVPLGLSLEYGANVELSEELASDLAMRISQLPQAHSSGRVRVFYVKGKIDPKFRGKGLRNYRYSYKVGGYPILVGESRYKTYAGFFADRVENVIIGSNDE